MLEQIKFLPVRILDKNLLWFFVHPISTLYYSLLALVKGDLFPINFNFGTTCGYMGPQKLGDGEAWLVIAALLTVIVVRLITKKPENLLILILSVYIAVYLAMVVSYMLAGPRPACI